MGVDKIVKLVGVLVAVVAGLVAFPYSATLVALLGLAGGWFIEKDDRMRFLVVTLAIAAVAGTLGTHGEGEAAMMVLPVVGDYISSALGGLSNLFNAAAVTVIVMGTIEAVKP